MTRPDRLVAIGGGHGLAITLEAARRWTSEITAVVTVADDGGSSGRLRRDLGVIAPGDLRRCLQALAPPGLLTDAIGHRFEVGELEGHPPGNVLLAGLLEQADSPVEAIDSLADAMSIVGRVLPSCVEPVDLVAETAAGAVVRGQVAVGATSGIVVLRWSPTHPVSPVAAIEAVLAADLIVLGPGSLYTSVLAAVAPDVRDAIAAASARVLYVANLAPQKAETEGYSVAHHVGALLRHGIIPSAVLVDDQAASEDTISGVEVVRASVKAASDRHHDVGLLAGALERYTAVTVSRSQDRIH
jgi:uncharacterized cofD-like protein